MNLTITKDNMIVTSDPVKCAMCGSKEDLSEMDYKGNKEFICFDCRWRVK